MFNQDVKKSGDRALTGYPSIDRPWLKYYEENAGNLPKHLFSDKTVWDVVEEGLLKYPDIPAIEYLGKTISRKRLINAVYVWADVLKSIGVKADDIVSVYSPFVPDLCAIVFAINMIGACSYFLKMDITPEDMSEETKESHFAIVLDEMWECVECEFSKDRFDKVLFLSATENMKTDDSDVGILSLENGSHHKDIREEDFDKYLRIEDIRRIENTAIKELRASYVKNRWAFITSSSGTTAKGKTKGVIATNESAIAQIRSFILFNPNYKVGDRCLNHFPPTVSTALCFLYILPLYFGETVVIDPRVSDDAFYDQLIRLKPSFVVHTGSAWEVFFDRIDKELKTGNKIDLSYARTWIIGGEGTDKRRFLKWDQLMKNAGADSAIKNGYGASELFSGVCVVIDENVNDSNKNILSVGIPYHGFLFGVFDDNGHELKYNERGEIWIKSDSAMYGYYGKRELTSLIKKDGWIRTGDLGEIDESGRIYVLGRMSDSVVLSNGQKVFLFDLALQMKECARILDVMVLNRTVSDSMVQIIVSIVWEADYSRECIEQFYIDWDKRLVDVFQDDKFRICFVEYDHIIPYSPTTYKKDRARLTEMKNGYFYVKNGKVLKNNEVTRNV